MPKATQRKRGLTRGADRRGSASSTRNDDSTSGGEETSAVARVTDSPPRKRMETGAGAVAVSVARAGSVAGSVAGSGAESGELTGFTGGGLVGAGTGLACSGLASGVAGSNQFGGQPTYSGATRQSVEGPTATSNVTISDMRGGASAEVVKGSGGLIKACKAITAKMVSATCDFGIPRETIKKLLEFSSEYEELLMTAIAENAHLHGKIEGLQKRPAMAVAAERALMPAPPVPALGAHAATLPKPVETWSVVVRSKNPSTTSKEVVQKVVKEVCPNLKVRVHEVKAVKGGGAIIRTPSVAEREKVAKNERFKEVGLNVEVNRKLGTRVVVQGVHTEITPDEFMSDLIRMNFENLSPGCRPQDVRLVSRPWEKTPDGTTNVVLEGADRLMSALLANGRCYIKWFSFRVRSDNPMPGCFRCMGFDHRVAECKMKSDVCRKCGQEGHRSAGCDNAVHCRNCQFKGLPAGHLMMSAACPIYGAIVARALARH
ncbi:unnamed protein product [Ceratitis capitata]|uniref:(Mediterranean fruit fly) hypothetical protein n=1 Tax=Ceratitis capitata TaxID=7213 RepID=A0A811UW95_CERCA|nr:unnamed protein product [Ceratitis capitata]